LVTKLSPQISTKQWSDIEAKLWLRTNCRIAKLFGLVKSHFLAMGQRKQTV
jgi:hypothetical protein